MVPFSYLRRATNTSILRRLLSLDELALPQTIKFVAAKALNGDEALFRSNDKHRNGVKAGRDLASLIQEKIRHTTVDEWIPSAIIAVVYYISQIRAPLDEATKVIFISKIASTHELNLIDLWQVLEAAKRLHLKVPLEQLKDHLQANVDKLLVGGSCKNVTSVINAFSTHDVAIDPGVLLYIAEYYRKEADRECAFKYITNFTNCLARQLHVTLKGNRSDVDGEVDRISTDNLLGTVKGLIGECLDKVEDNIHDTEGIVGVLDALVVSHLCCRPDDEEHSRQYAQVEHLLKVINSSLSTVDSTKTDIGEHHFDSKIRNIEPRILRVILRNAVLVGMQQPELIARIVGMHRCQTQRWSAQGNADVLRSVVFFGYRGPEVGDLAGHIASLYHGKFSKYVDPGKVLIDACLLAVDAKSQPYHSDCMRLVTSALTAIDSINTRDIALAMMILGLSSLSYEVVPLVVLQKILRRLHGSIITLEVHTRANAASTQSRLAVDDTVFHDHFACFCKLKLK